MKQELISFSQRYEDAWRRHLKQRGRASLRPALALGRRAVALGLETLELARIHDRAVANVEAPRPGKFMGKRAADFFDEAITAIVETHRAARHSREGLNRLNGMLGRRTVRLATANRKLQQGIARRKTAESALKKSGQDYSKLLKNSLQLQEKLRQLTHQLLAAQEEERGKISRELQDDIAQTLLGINVRLLSLKREARSNTRGLRDGIARTQRLVEKSAKTVRRVARKYEST